MAEMTLVQAVRRALWEELHDDPTVIVMGEDVGRLGGVFRATDGLLEEFGQSRVIDAPLEELGIAGVAIGAAMSGLRPVIEMQFADYIHPAYDQIVNEAAKIHYRSNGAFTCPIVVRAPCGAGVHGGMYHSQSVEALFFHIPGLKIVVPSTPYDCKGLLKSAIRDDDPVLFFEHKRIYRSLSGEVPETDYTVPLGRADVKRMGKHVSAITYGIGVHLALEAAARLEEEGVSLEVLDLRTVAPLDVEAIRESVKKCGKVMVLHEDNRTGGIGAEVSAFIAEECFDLLDGPVIRIGAADTHIPFARTLEEAVLPNAEDVVLAARDLIRR